MRSLLREVFSTKGRIGAGRYWLHSLVSVGVILALSFFFDLDKEESTPKQLLMLVVIIVFLESGFASMIRRLHDLDRPGWHFLLMLVPVANVPLGFALAFVRGTVGPNRFGPDPLAAHGARDTEAVQQNDSVKWATKPVDCSMDPDSGMQPRG